MKKRGLTDILIQIVLAELTGAVSALISGQMDMTGLVQPPLSPPGWLFPVAWTVLYALMGWSAGLILTSDGDEGEKSAAMKVYYFQLVLNFLWSIIYFRAGLLTAAAAVIGAMIVLVFIMIMRFRRINRLAARLNIPYLLWLCFALYLNIGTVLLNPTA